MKFLSDIKLLAVLVSVVALVSGGKILTEKPDYLQPCKVSDPSFSSCYANTLRVLFIAWKDGVPGLNSVGGINPLHIKSISIAPPSTDLITLNIILKDIVIDGLSNIVPKESSFKTNKLILKFRLLVPKMDVQANYEMKGNILNLALDGNGMTTATFDNTIVDIALRFKLRQEGGYTFADVDKIHVDIAKIGAARFHLANLFNGDKALEDSANDLLNENWETLFEVGRPGLNEAFASVMKDRLSKVYDFIPATYFFDDLPGA